MLIDLSGQWTVRLSDGSTYPVQLPGTLDENHVGHEEEPHIRTRLTRVCTYEGPAAFSCVYDKDVPSGRLFLEVERSRALSLSLDGRDVSPLDPPNISTPYVFEVTGLMRNGSRITLTCDNSYPGMPHDNIVYSSAATDETQTNWNGLLGFLRLRAETSVFIENVRVFPKGNMVDIEVDINASDAANAEILLSSSAFEPVFGTIEIEAGRKTYFFPNVPVLRDAAKWDEYEGSLHELTVTLSIASGTVSEKKTSFGLRVFSSNEEGRFTLNGRVLFIRSEANCAEFPETGHDPMTVEEWLTILNTYKSYGINCVRFHSHCPPEAAFAAADQMGILMQPELSHWNPRNAFESDFSRDYYFAEASAIVKHLANHPSFVMLTFGNELWTGEVGHQLMHELIDLLHKQDPTRLYADGSNVHYGTIGCDPNSDFYTSQKYFDMDLRGTFAEMKGFINNEYPSATHNYDDTMAALRETYKKPVFSFEVGQFEVLPDFDEIEDFHGVRLPVNLEIIRDGVKAQGLLPRWKEYVEATGEVSLLGYRAEIEAVLRTPGMSGISLLGLQDFTGQGTALVGMLNSHLQPKPFSFADPARFHRFFNDVVPLALMPRFTMSGGETLSVPLRIANYGKYDLNGPLHWMLKAGERIVDHGELIADAPMGRLSDVGSITLSPCETGRFDLVLEIGEWSNEYPLWVYSNSDVKVPDDVHIARTLDEALPLLQQGCKVFLSPVADKSVLPHSIRTQFTTDFWSVGTFPKQEGGMSFLIDKDHPALKDFPTNTHTDYQWWAMSNGLGVEVPSTLRSIVTVMDSYAYLRPMTALFEAKVGGGRLLFSSMGLLENTRYPEVKALLNSLLSYMDSDAFAPDQEMDAEALSRLFQA